jgi:hypothetical protein
MFCTPPGAAAGRAAGSIVRILGKVEAKDSLCRAIIGAWP